MQKRCGFSGLLACCVMAFCAAPAAAKSDAPCPGPFPAPAGPMHLTRQIHRSLADGKELVVTRHYLLRFHPNAQGFEIEGEWRGTDVEAPARLAALADMEKAQGDSTSFPMQLDRGGMILPMEPAKRRALGEDEVVEARRLIAGANLRPVARQHASEFVEQLASQPEGMITQWPAALFRPGGLDSQTRREMPLPDDKGGKAIITVSAHAGTLCGVMRQMERKVQTMIAGQMRETREIWTLSPASD